MSKKPKKNPKAKRPKRGITLANLSFYLILNGQVYSLLEGRYLKGCVGSKGYLSVWLRCDDGVRRWFLVHRLVAMALLPNPRKLPIVHHIDGNRLNANVSNLMWVSQKTNMELAAASGRMSHKVSDDTKQRMSESAKKGLCHYRCKGIYSLDGRTAETLQGLAQATGKPLTEIRRLNRMGELKPDSSQKQLRAIADREQAPTLRI